MAVSYGRGDGKDTDDSMLDQKKAVIFDLDGTLMDSMWLWGDIDIEYLGRYGYTPPEGLEKEIEGMSFTETAVYFKKRFSLPDSVDEIKREWNRMAYEKYAHQVNMKPGASRFLQMLKVQGIKTAIASSNSRELIMACLAGNHAEGYFDFIITSCDVAKGKPAPDIYLCVAEKFGISPEECLVFEDVPMGILAGKNAGMQVCAMEDAFSLDQREQIRSLADYYIKTYDQVINHTYEVLK